VTNQVSRRLWVWVAAGIVFAISAGVVAAGASPDRRAALMAQLERPASPATALGTTTSVAARHGHAVVTLDRRVYAVSVAPNRASARNQLALTVTQRGLPVPGATVSVAFSMPAMNMWRAFSVNLGHSASGRYATTLPFVGMPGVWRLDVRVALPGHVAAAFAVADVLGS
jgi:hypothetical protein